MDSLHSSLPSGIPLVVKASCDERIKRIRFPPDLTLLQFCDFQEKVAKALQFDDVDFKITWEDDDGEHCDIGSTDDLQEAIFYFCPSEIDSTTQALTMRVNVRLDAKVSLSDYGSSIWGGSDDEGTIASTSSRSEKSFKSSNRSKTFSDFSNGSKSKDSNRSYTTPRSFKQSSSSSQRSNGNKKGVPSTSSQGWRAATCSRWFGKNDLAGSLKDVEVISSYDNAMSSLQSLDLSRSSNGDGDADSSGGESENSAHTRGPTGKRSRKRPSMMIDEALIYHNGVTCRACHTSPIVGMRYHCASCPGGADFCSECERSGFTINGSFGHEISHAMLRLAEPLDSSKAIDALNANLVEAQKRLMKQMTLTCSRDGGTTRPLASDACVNKMTVYSNKLVKCSFCISPILQGPRFLCANCPLVTESSMEGFNLCSTCQVHSLQCHDPSHFFIKIKIFSRNMVSRSRIPLGERWQVQEATKGGALLPTLYAEVEQRDPLQPPMLRSNSNLSIRSGDGLSITNDVSNGHSTGFHRAVISSALRTGGAEARKRAQEIELTAMRESQSRYLVPLDRLVHPSILCDNCFSVINGVWFRCCHCTTSFDLCETCEGKIAHDPNHSFAVFKQPVDLDLFKSCVDHQDAGEGLLGASRPMLSFPLQ